MMTPHQPSNDDERRWRYRRQTAFAAFGESGQQRLQKASVLIVGSGALGCSAANLLVRAGLGRLVLVDPDTVQIDNLHRQILFDETDITRLKVEAAREKLLRADSRANIETHPIRFEPETADKLLRGIDLLLDGTDHFVTRLAMNAAAIKHRLPMVTAGVLGAAGQAMTILPGETPCLACLIDPEDRESLDRPSGMEETGILAPVVQVMAALEVMETMKILGGRPDAVRHALWSADLWRNKFQTIAFDHLPTGRCPVCGWGDVKR